MKVVLFDKEEPKVGGIGIYTTRLHHHLKTLGHEVYILRFTHKKPKDKNIFCLPYLYAEERGFLIIPTTNTQQIISQHLLKLKPDIVYTPIGLSLLDFLIPSLCHEYNIPIAGVWHADFNYNLSAHQILVKSLLLAYAPFCKQLDLLHVFSEKMAQFYQRRGVDRKKILVLPNGVDQNFYSPGPSFFGKNQGIKTGILFIGRLTMQKNPEVVIRSFRELDPPSGTKLVLVGCGDMETTLKETYRSPQIIFTGAIKDEQKKLDIIRSCQIFTLPSRFEGMPLAILEAMSCGLACITSDAGSNKELLEKTGIIIPSTTMREGLTLTLRLLLEHPDISKILGQKARNRILKYYSQETIFNRLQKALKEAIADYQERGSPKTAPLEIDLNITKQLKSLWRRVKQISSSL